MKIYCGLVRFSFLAVFAAKLQLVDCLENESKHYIDRLLNLITKLLGNSFRSES